MTGERGYDRLIAATRVHWIGEHNNTLHGNGAGSKDMTHTSGDEDDVTCSLCLTLLAREDVRERIAPAPVTGETTDAGEGLSEADRNALWWTIVSVRDGAPRTPDDADTDDIIDAILDSGLIHRLTSAAATRAADDRAERIAQDALELVREWTQMDGRLVLTGRDLVDFRDQLADVISGRTP